jgi:hypothetical protein
VRVAGAVVSSRLTATGLEVDLPDAAVTGCGEAGAPVTLAVEGASAPFAATVRARSTARVARLATGAWSRVDGRCPVLVPAGGSVHLTLARADSLEDVTTAVPDTVSISIGAAAPIGGATAAAVSVSGGTLAGRLPAATPATAPAVGLGAARAAANGTPPQCPLVLPGATVRLGVAASRNRDTVHSLTRVDFSARRTEDWRVVAGDSTLAVIADAGVEARLARDTAAAGRLATLVERWGARIRPFLAVRYGELNVRPGLPGQQVALYLSEQFTLSAIASVGPIGRLDCAGIEWGVRLRPTASFGGTSWRADGSLENVMVHEAHHILDFAGLAPGAQRPTTVRLAEGFAVMGEHLYAATRLGFGEPVLADHVTSGFLYDGALYRAWWDAPALGSFPAQLVGNYPLNGRLVLWAFAQARRAGVPLATAVDRFRTMPERLTLQQVVESVTGAAAPAGDAFLRWTMGLSVDDVVPGLSAELADPTWNGSITRREPGSGWWRPAATVGAEAYTGTVRLIAADWSTLRIAAPGHVSSDSAARWAALPWASCASSRPPATFTCPLDGGASGRTALTCAPSRPRGGAAVTWTGGIRAPGRPARCGAGRDVRVRARARAAPRRGRRGGRATASGTTRRLARVAAGPVAAARVAVALEPGTWTLAGAGLAELARRQGRSTRVEAARAGD